MTSPLTCPACAASFRLAEDVSGRRVFCPKCGQSLIITGDGTGRRGERERPAPAAPAGGRQGLLVPVLAGLLLLVGGIAVGLYLSRDRPDRQPLAQQPPEPVLRKLPPAPAAGKDGSPKLAEENTPGGSDLKGLPKEDPAKAKRTPAPEPPLAWKFKEGDRFYVELDTDTALKIESQGQVTGQKHRVTQVISYTVKKAARDPDGATVLQQRFEDVRAYPAENCDPCRQQLELVAKALKGTTFTVTLGKDGKVTRFEGYGAFVERFAQDRDAAAKLLKVLPGEDAFKEDNQELFGSVPDKAVAAGDRWQRRYKVAIGPCGSVKLANEYTYEGKEGGRDRIRFKGRVDAGGADCLGPVALGKLTTTNLPADGVRGTLLFDRGTGRLVRSAMSVTTRMALKASGGDGPQVTLTSTENTTRRVLDHNPWVEQGGN